MNFRILLALLFCGCIEFSSNFKEEEITHTIIMPAMVFEHDGSKVINIKIGE